MPIRIDRGINPIKGTLRQQPDDTPEPFSGWLDLTQPLETVRSSSFGADWPEDEPARQDRDPERSSPRPDRHDSLADDHAAKFADH
jgi:hypothetical protein